MRGQVRCIREELWRSNGVFMDCFRELDPFRPIGGWGELGAIDPRLIEWWIKKERKGGRKFTARQLREIPLFVPRMDLAWRNWKHQESASKHKKPEVPEDV